MSLSWSSNRPRWRAALGLAAGATLLLSCQVKINAQGVDCERLRSMIAAGGDNGSARAARQQAAELARAQGYAHQLGCDQGGFSFFGGGGSNPQCPALTDRIRRMQANLQRLQAGGGGSDLVARYNAYCRQQPRRERGFFESLFGSSDDPPPAPPPADLPADAGPDEGEDTGVHGGSQAICVRTCDGGFFPMAMSSHHSASSLSEMCTALCPGTEAVVYTRNPDADVKTAVGLDGKPYMDLPNALKFQKNYTPSCSCLPAGKTWAEALANAEEVMGNQRKGDILVTQEKSDELSRPKLDDKARATLLRGAQDAKADPAAGATSPPKAAPQVKEVVGPDGTKRTVRQVGPQL